MSTPTRLTLPREMPQPLLLRWIAILSCWLYPPARRLRGRRVRSAAKLGAWVLGSCAAIALAMLSLDARGVAAAHLLPLWVVDVFNEITDFGQSHWFLVPIGVTIVIAALLVRPATERLSFLVLTSLVVRLEFIFLAVALPGLFVTVIKRLIGRVRPSDLGPFAYVPWSWRPEYASLPSGHATTAFAAAIAIGAVWPKARIPMWVYAVIIALSRVVITAHFVSDVLAGACVGVLGAMLVRNWFAARGLVFDARADGTIRAKPGPSWRRVKSVAARLLAR